MPEWNVVPETENLTTGRGQNQKDLTAEDAKDAKEIQDKSQHPSLRLRAVYDAEARRTPKSKKI
jgi:hypothetical protein